MRRSVPVRIAVSLLVCGLVGACLAASAGARLSTRRVVVTTRSSHVVEGDLRGYSAEGIMLGVDDRVQLVPWEAVSGLSVASLRATDR